MLFCEVVAQRLGPVHEGLIYFGRKRTACPVWNWAAGSAIMCRSGGR